jgi:hypothetical protein
VNFVQLIYYAHSYRPVDDTINEFFQELMVDEQLTPSLDPKSDRLNAAKPERHLRTTDAMVAVLTRRDPAPSEYIRWEVRLGVRARKPQLVFVEDTLPDDLVPPGLLQRRFSRRRLLREARDHRYALRLLKGYVGTDPPPTYQPGSTRRCCAILGASGVADAMRAALETSIESAGYTPLFAPAGSQLSQEVGFEDALQRAGLCVALIEGLSASEYYMLGVARSALTPTVLVTHDALYPFHPVIPREYQPRYVQDGNLSTLTSTIATEIDIFEEDYLELVEEKQIKRYKAFQELLLRNGRNAYSQEARQQVVNFMGNAEVDMSKDKIQVNNVVGPVNIKSRLDHVVQKVQGAGDMAQDKRQELAALIEELKASLGAVNEQRPDDAERVTRTAELLVSEATKAKPNAGFLSFSAEGLKQAAQAVADIAPTVLTVAGKVAAFVAGVA